MRRVLLAIFLAIIVMAAAAVDSAKAENPTFSADEWTGIKKIVEEAYPRGVDVRVVLTERWFTLHVEVEAFTPDERDYIKVDVYPVHAYVIIREVGSAENMSAAEKIKERIEIMLNASAQKALKR